MSLFRRLFGKPGSHQPITPLNAVAKQIEQVIDHTVNDLFTTYHELLVRESIVYIVYAVWGARKDGELTPEQHDINSKVLPVISTVRKSLANDQTTPQQEYAIDYLVRSLIISKITFMIEHLKRTMADTHDAPSASESAPQLPDSVSDEWLDNLNITDSESWRRRFGSSGDA